MGIFSFMEKKKNPLISKLNDGDDDLATAVLAVQDYPIAS
jgi:hypothetical protein